MHFAIAALFSASLLVAQNGQEPSAPGGTPAPDAAAPAEQEPSADSAEVAAMKSLLASLHYQTGKVQVADLATMDLPPDWRFLGAADARKVLERIWGNPPDTGTLGLVFPPGGDPIDNSFAVVCSFEKEGFVKDDDAAGLDYGEMLTQMQQSTRENNAARKQHGYEPIELLGWAEPPHYDAKEKKLYWAKRLRFGDNPEPQLNYDVRILGRNGYLVLTAVAGDKDLAAVAAGCKDLLRVTGFVEGKRYENFDPAYDKIAAYGIGGLIAGKVLLKVGILKLLLKPLLVVGVLVVGAVGRLFGRKKAAPSTSARARRTATPS